MALEGCGLLDFYQWQFPRFKEMFNKILTVGGGLRTQQNSLYSSSAAFRRAASRNMPRDQSQVTGGAP